MSATSSTECYHEYMYIVDTTEKMWAGESEDLSIYHLALDIMHYSLLHISQLNLKWKRSKTLSDAP